MRKLSYEYILFYLQLTLSGVFLLVFFVFNVPIEEKDFLKRGMISQNAIGFELQPRVLEGNSLFFFPDEGVILFSDIVDWPTAIVRGYYGKEDVFGFEDLLEKGRFFDTQDVKDELPVAVIGSNRILDVIIDNGVQYIGVEGQRYEVIGIFEPTGTYLDHTIYLNLMFLINNQSVSGRYFIDGMDEFEVNKSFEELNTVMGTEHFINSHEFRASWINIMNPRMEALVYAVMIGVQSNLILTIIFYVIRKKYKVAIQKMCGMTKGNLIINQGRPIFFICSASFVSILFLHQIFQDSQTFLDLPTLQLGHYILTGATIYSIGIGMIYFVTVYSGEVNISKTLKGR